MDVIFPEHATHVNSPPPQYKGKHTKFHKVSQWQNTKFHKVQKISQGFTKEKHKVSQGSQGFTRFHKVSQRKNTKFHKFHKVHKVSQGFTKAIHKVSQGSQGFTRFHNGKTQSFTRFHKVYKASKRQSGTFRVPAQQQQGPRSMGRREEGEEPYVCQSSSRHTSPQHERAVKCNATPSVLRLLADLGSSFDCASKQEISSVLSHGVCPDRIVFAHPCKMASHVTYAAERHVAMMTFDNELELVKVKRLYPAARLILRIACDDRGALYKVNCQYGASLHDTRHLLTVARQLNLDVIGVSFHVGSGCPEVDAWSVAISNAKRVFEEGAEIGFSFSLLDIGGGFPGETTTRIPFDDICDAVSSALEEHFPADSRVRVIAEPGRYMVGSALTLVVNVIAKRTVFRGNDGTVRVVASNRRWKTRVKESAVPASGDPRAQDSTASWPTS
ncbi:PREDICTED: ornithine decarboxylase-like [Priapulus caudatus]|uniref:Ornithine decarboxylase-like n=1 Tax=Priapulus caudatus TaxID=37621 RepID=A0ABM1F0C2_PRICU|nr:PREDICTED: ornithine decarboxylase-like [Priapulus caudatus]